MARSKKEPVEVLEEDLELLDESIEEALEPEAVESDENDDEEKTKAPKPKRKPRARKAPAAPAVVEEIEEEADSAPEEEPEDETVISGTEILNAGPKKKSQTKIKETDLSDHLREDAAIASAGLEKSMESMAKQWVSIQQISGSICTSLERVSEMLQEIPQQMEAMRPPASRPAPITKIAVGMSGLAILLSILSISFSQSVRQNVLGAEAIASPKPAVRIASSNKPTPPPVAPVVQEKAAEPVPEIIPKAPAKTAQDEKRSDLKQEIERVEAKLAAETAASKSKKKIKRNKR